METAVLLLGAIVCNLPLASLLWLAVFRMTRWSLQRTKQRVRLMVRFILLLCTSVLGLGLAYGVLRFCGVITFLDERAFCDWFHTGWQNDGFKYIYRCGTALLGIASACVSVLKGERNGREEKQYPAQSRAG